MTTYFRDTTLETQQTTCLVIPAEVPRRDRDPELVERAGIQKPQVTPEDPGSRLAPLNCASRTRHGRDSTGRASCAAGLGRDDDLQPWLQGKGCFVFALSHRSSASLLVLVHRCKLADAYERRSVACTGCTVAGTDLWVTSEPPDKRVQHSIERP